MNSKRLALSLLLPIALNYSAPVLNASYRHALYADSGNQLLISELKSSGISTNPEDYSFKDDEGIIGYGKEGNTLLIYWMGASDVSIPDSVFWAKSYTSTAFLPTGMTVRNSGVSSNYNLRCFSVDNTELDLSQLSSVYINSIYYHFGQTDSVIHPVSKTVTFDSSSNKFQTSSVEYLTVTDKLVSFWNTVTGTSTYWGIFANGATGYDENYEAYTEHYVAFNLDTDFDSILSVDIQTKWHIYLGYTDISAGRRWDNEGYSSSNPSVLDYKELEENISNAIDQFGTSAFRKDSSSYWDGATGSFEHYHVDPNDVTRSTYWKVFGIPTGKKIGDSYTWNQIMDFDKAAKEGDAIDGIKSTLDYLFGKKAYSQVSKNLLNTDGTVKYRWFVQYYENKLRPNVYSTDSNYESHPPVLAHGLHYYNQYYYLFSHDYPFQIADDLSILKVKYIKNGKTYESCVVDKAASSTGDSVIPLVPNTDGNADWSWLFWVIVALFGGIAIAIAVSLFTPAAAVVKAIFKVIGWILRSLIIVLYDVTIWWWVATIAKANGKEVPAANPFAKKGKK